MKSVQLLFKREIRMSNKPILTSKMPYATSADDIVERYNYLVKTVNSSFVSEQSPTVAQANDVISLNGVEVSQSFSGPSGTLFTTFTIAHSLGSIPSGYIISDYEYSSGSLTAEMHSISRVSWTATDITVRLNVTTGTGTAFGGSFKLLVLR